MIATIIGIVFISAFAVGPIMSDVEIPNYEVLKSQSNIEIRQYEPMIIAEVQTAGARKEAIREGFRSLADYIFGNNRSNQDIAMTAPVQQQASNKIEMTAPVQQQSVADGLWQVSFVMPSKYNMETLPKPNNQSITLKDIPKKQFIAIKFSGTSSDENVKEHERQLLEYVKANSILITGLPQYAFYNPPWTLPFMRRNEVMIEIQQ